MSLYYFTSHINSVFTTIKYVLQKSPRVFMHLQGHLELVKVLKPYRQANLISSRTYAIYTSSYISKTLSIKEKLEILHYHYSYLKKIFDPVSIEQLFKSGLPCWSESVPPSVFNVPLIFSGMLEFEGSLSLFFNVNAVRIFTMSFSFIPG